MQQPSQNRQQQPPGGRRAGVHGIPSAPVGVGMGVGVGSSWSLAGEDLLGRGRLSVSSQGVLHSETPATAPSHGGLCSFCHIWQWNRQCPLAIRRDFSGQWFFFGFNSVGSLGPCSQPPERSSHFDPVFCRKHKVGKTQVRSHLETRCSIIVDLRLFDKIRG